MRWKSSSTQSSPCHPLPASIYQCQHDIPSCADSALRPPSLPDIIFAPIHSIRQDCYILGMAGCPAGHRPVPGTLWGGTVAARVETHLVCTVLEVLCGLGTLLASLTLLSDSGGELLLSAGVSAASVIGMNEWRAVAWVMAVSNTMTSMTSCDREMHSRPLAPPLPPPPLLLAPLPPSPRHLPSPPPSPPLRQVPRRVPCH
jgi:hypothetical protein